MMHLVKAEELKGERLHTAHAGGQPPGKTPGKGYFLLDRAYVRKQAKEAIRLFFAPSAGVYSAVTGQNPRITAEGQKKA